MPSYQPPAPCGLPGCIPAPSGGWLLYYQVPVWEGDWPVSSTMQGYTPRAVPGSMRHRPSVWFSGCPVCYPPIGGGSRYTMLVQVLYHGASVRRGGVLYW
jgi:hypothetical protein